MLFQVSFMLRDIAEKLNELFAPVLAFWILEDGGQIPELTFNSGDEK